MRLSIRERDVLATVGLSAHLSLTELAETARLPLHQFHYLIAKLSEQKIIKKAWIIDTFKLGYSRFNIFFSLGRTTKSSRAALIRMLANTPETVFFSEIGGDFDFELSVLVKDAIEFRTFMHTLAKKYGELFQSKIISIRHTMAHFSRKYLASKPLKPSYLAIGGEVTASEIDALDRSILTIIAQNPLYSRRDIARAIGHPESTVDLRFKQLLHTGIIKGALWTTDARQYGAQTFKLLLQTRGLEQTFAKDLFAFASKHPHITTYIEGIGVWDFELGVEVQEYSELCALREELYTRFGTLLHEIKVLNRFSVYQYRSFVGLPN